MTITRDQHQHPLLDAVVAVSADLDKAIGFNPTFVPVGDKATALRELSTIVTRTQGLLLSLLAASGDVADETGARSAGAWYAATTRHDHRPATALEHLASSLDRDYPHLGAAVSAGRVNLDQAHVITHALDDLTDDTITAEVRERAELHLIDLADDWAPTPLRRLARKVLDVIAPEIAEEAERKTLEREEHLAADHTRLTLTPLGDGTTRITGRLPDATATRLRTYLEAFASPRRTATEADGHRIPTPRLLGLALTDLLEVLPAHVLPAHGGTATTITVHLDLDQLTTDLEAAGVATLETGDTITTGQARRLACQAKILPAVLGGKSEVLDLGRTRRLHSGAQRKAIRLIHTHCQADGCTVPAAWCETHHPTPGPTAAPPTSSTPHSSAPTTTTEPTTPATSPTDSSTATTASTAGPRPRVAQRLPATAPRLAQTTDARHAASHGPGIEHAARAGTWPRRSRSDDALVQYHRLPQLRRRRAGHTEHDHAVPDVNRHDGAGRRRLGLASRQRRGERACPSGPDEGGCSAVGPGAGLRARDQYGLRRSMARGVADGVRRSDFSTAPPPANPVSSAFWADDTSVGRWSKWSWPKTAPCGCSASDGDRTRGW
ncbi:DUF222 domain-containing protein [Nocardioides sp.]|uniref:DUF222 domain-containing protein n=1 Tax=Nocardioides sp. TaxID=35761 RepID=UPI002B95E79C|nr:DUF222 domain-containing protein [Nocardioides sp.]HXH77618.1 DUF222 domain-containing protein [Nocardioides sp.]